MIKVAVAVIKREGKVLIARRQKEGPLKGKWEFPGGKIEDGETPEECLKRELSEELGIKAHVAGFIDSTSHEYEHIHVNLSFYNVELLSEEIIPKDYREIRWISPDKLNSYDFPEANRPVMRKLARGT